MTKIKCNKGIAQKLAAILETEGFILAENREYADDTDKIFIFIHEKQ